VSKRNLTIFRSAPASSEAPVGSGSALLSVRHLHKRFGGVVAAEDITFDVPPGGVLGLIGPNGAGKSTLLKTICGECRADSGEVWFDGRRIDRLPRHAMARLGVVLAHQIPRPFADLTVRENVTLGALAARDRSGPSVPERVNDAITDAGLQDKAAMPARTLSVVDLKRLEVARALSLSPRLLLLDEVGAGLVQEELRSMIAVLERVAARGVTLLVVEHVEQVIKELAGHVLVLDWGKVVSEGSPEAVAGDPRVKSLYLGTGPRPGEQRRRPRAGTAERLLVLGGVHADYGGAHALRDVDIEVRQGEVVALVGANGAGKTTLANVISGNKRASAGAVTYDGREISAVPTHRRVELGIAHAHEGRRIFGELTVRENLALGAYGRRARHQAEDGLRQVEELFPELVERREQRGGTLSGGQQQMLAIARALMSSPRLLVLDEVSLGLAPVMADRIYEALEAIAAGGLSVLLIEQNVRRSLGCADRAYVLDHGSISFAGAPEELEHEARLLEAYFGQPAGLTPATPLVTTAKGTNQ
jgi:branched-chain amino acid transport system ATP-binding protein